MFCNVRLACERAEERTSRICCRLADDSIALSDLRTRWNGTRLETTCDYLDFFGPLLTLTPSLILPFSQNWIERRLATCAR